MSDTSPRLGLPYIAPSQAQKHVTHNEALHRLDALVHLVLVGIDATDPPASPVAGEAYAIGAEPAGAWAGQAGRLASWDGIGWQFITVREGWRAWDLASGTAHVFAGDTWQAEISGLNNLESVGIGTGADAVNRLAVASDATLLTHAGSGHQLKVNKASSGDTASLLFQTGYDGRAEMGLAGNDAFAVKMRAPGGSWSEMMRMDPAAQAITLATGAGAELQLTQEGLALNMAPGGVEDWRPIYSQGNALGAVSQAGGQVTGALFESASTANGSYVKFADGTLICTLDAFDLAYVDSSTLRGDWVFPHAFASGARILNFVLRRKSGALPVANYRAGICLDDTEGIDAATTGRMTILSNGVFTNNGPLSVRATAIGRWF